VRIRFSVSVKCECGLCPSFAIWYICGPQYRKVDNRDRCRDVLNRYERYLIITKNNTQDSVYSAVVGVQTFRPTLLFSGFRHFVP